MSSYVARHHEFTLEAYFATERRPDAGKHEFADGQIYAMSGGSPRHNHLAGQTYRLLAERLGGGPCVALPSDQRIATADGLYTYADASVFHAGWAVCARHVVSVTAWPRNPSSRPDVRRNTARGSATSPARTRAFSASQSSDR